MIDTYIDRSQKSLLVLSPADWALCSLWVQLLGLGPLVPAPAVECLVALIAVQWLGDHGVEAYGTLLGLHLRLLHGHPPHLLLNNLHRMSSQPSLDGSKLLDKSAAVCGRKGWLLDLLQKLFHQSIMGSTFLTLMKILGVHQPGVGGTGFAVSGCLKSLGINTLLALHPFFTYCALLILLMFLPRPEKGFPSTHHLLPKF